MATHWFVGPESQPPADAWWDILAQNHLLRNAGTRPIVVHVSRTRQAARVLATARALVAFLRRSMPQVPVEVLDPAGTPADWPGVPIVDLAAQPRVRVSAPRLPDGVDIPARWLEPFSLVTICGAAPHPRFVVAGVLAAQGELLGNERGFDLDVVFEAHRLLAPDLGIVCGSRIYGSNGSDSWWAAGAHDASVDASVAAAAGTDPTRLPLLAHLARHESTTMQTTRDTNAPTLEGYVASPGAVRTARTRERLRCIAAAVGDDVRLAARNLHRIPQFVERRYPRLVLWRSAS